MTAMLFVFLTGLGASVQTSLDPLLQEGDAHYRRFENLQALREYERALDAEGEEFAVLWRLARAGHDYGLDLVARKEKSQAEAQLVEAVAYAEKLVAKYPEEVLSHFFLAATHGSLARFKGGKGKVEIGGRVEASCLEALELDPEFALAYSVLGVYYREVAELNWMQRAVARLLYGGVPKFTKEQTVQTFLKALELDPSLAFAHYELALTYESMGRRQEAIRHLMHTVELPAQTSQDQRNQEEARSLLRKWR